MHTPACHPHHQIHSESKWTRGCGLLWKPFQAWTDHVKCQHPCSSLPRQTPRGPANWVHWHKSYIGQMPWKTSGKGCIQIIPSKPNRWSHCFLKNISNASSNMQMPGWTQCLMVLGARNRKIEFNFCYSSYEAVPFQFWTKPPPHANKPVLDKLPVESLVTGCLPVACTKRLPVMPPCRFCLAAMRDWGDSSPAIKSNAEAIITKVDHQFWTPKARNQLGRQRLAKLKTFWIPPVHAHKSWILTQIKTPCEPASAAAWCLFFINPIVEFDEEFLRLDGHVMENVCL